MTGWNLSKNLKEDLEDFKIENNLEDIKSNVKHSFKKYVKERAKDHALEILNALKDGHSKMDNLHYTEIKIFRLHFLKCFFS